MLPYYALAYLICGYITVFFISRYTNKLDEGEIWSTIFVLLIWPLCTAALVSRFGESLRAVEK